MSKNNSLENVLILQGGGSLGAFGCGVFKALANNNVKLDIIAGTSIGGVNAAIIAGSTEDKHPEKTLEQFWLELSENSKAVENFSSLHSPSFMEWLAAIERPFSPSQENSTSSSIQSAVDKNLKIKSILSSIRFCSLWK